MERIPRDQLAVVNVQKLVREEEERRKEIQNYEFKLHWTIKAYFTETKDLQKNVIDITKFYHKVDVCDKQLKEATSTYPFCYFGPFQELLDEAYNALPFGKKMTSSLVEKFVTFEQDLKQATDLSIEFFNTDVEALWYVETLARRSIQTEADTAYQNIHSKAFEEKFTANIDDISAFRSTVNACSGEFNQALRTRSLLPTHAWSDHDLSPFQKLLDDAKAALSNETISLNLIQQFKTFKSDFQPTRINIVHAFAFYSHTGQQEPVERMSIETDQNHEMASLILDFKKQQEKIPRLGPVKIALRYLIHYIGLFFRWLFPSDRSRQR